MKRLLIVLGVVWVLGGCVVAHAPLSPEVAAYDARVMAQSTEFTHPAASAEEAWSRANQFVATYSSYRIQVANAYVVQTFMTDSSWPKFGYSITRTAAGEHHAFSVRCITSNMFSTDRAAYNAHALAWYMASGELMPNRINK